MPDQIVRNAACTACDGRGWFLKNPFATGGGNGCGGISNTIQCAACLTAYDAHMAAQGDRTALKQGDQQP